MVVLPEAVAVNPVGALETVSMDAGSVVALTTVDAEPAFT